MTYFFLGIVFLFLINFLLRDFLLEYFLLVDFFLFDLDLDFFTEEFVIRCSVIIFLFVSADDTEWNNRSSEFEQGIGCVIEIP